MGITVDRHSVQREEVVARAAAAHVHRRGAIGARSNSGQALHPTDRVSLADRRDDGADAFNACLKVAESLFDTTGIRLHGRIQRIEP